MAREVIDVITPYYSTPGAVNPELLAAVAVNVAAEAAARLPALADTAVSQVLGSQITAKVIEQVAASETVTAAAASAAGAALAGILGAAKCVHREGTTWVWDGPGAAKATHYVLPDPATGAPVARPTLFPVPAAAPEFTW